MWGSIDTKRGRISPKVIQQVDGEAWIKTWFFNPLSGALLTSNSLPTVELNVMWFSPFNYSHCPSQWLAQITKALEGLWWVHLWLIIPPFFWEKDFLFVRRKCPFSIFSQLLTAPWHLGGGEVTKILLSPWGTMQPNDLRDQTEHRSRSQLLHWIVCEEVNNYCLFWDPSCYCYPTRHALWWESPGDNG